MADRNRTTVRGATPHRNLPEKKDAPAAANAIAAAVNGGSQPTIVARTLEPWECPGNDLVLGYDERGRLVILPYQDRAQHVFVCGRTGMGKSREVNSFIRQDIANWDRTGCPVVVFDPDDELVRSVVQALACTPRLHDRPVVFIDCANRKLTIAWNPLQRHENVDPSVTAANMLDAIAHATGQLDLAQNHTTQRTLETAFEIAIEYELTFTQLMEVYGPSATAARAEIARTFQNSGTRLDMERLISLSKQQVDAETVALWNRLKRLTNTRLLRAMFSRATGGFSFDWVLERGAIVLVSFAKDGGTLTGTQARQLCALMLANLWQAAERRGKAAAGKRRPCYVYIDEAPFVLSPALALQLPRARGFGLHFTLAAQRVSQFEELGGANGAAIQSAVLGDTLTKIIFAQSAEPKAIQPLSCELLLPWYDSLLRKHTTTSFQVVGEEREEYWTISHNATRSASSGEDESTSHASHRATIDTWSNTHGTGSASALNHAHTDSQSITPELLVADTYGAPVVYGASDTAGATETTNAMESSTVGGSAQRGDTVTAGRRTNRSVSATDGEGAQQHYRWRQIIQERETGAQFYSRDDQQTICEQMLYRLPKGHAFVSIQGMPPVEIRTPRVDDPEYVDPEWVDEMLEDFRRDQDFWVPLEDAQSPAAVAEESQPTRLRSYGRRGRPKTEAPGEEEDGE